VFYATERGTPQGGVASPLLANIALHGMEEAIGVTYNCRGELVGKRAVVRYADDFVCFCETREDAEQVQSILTEWLRIAWPDPLRGEDAYRSPHGRLRLPELQYSTLPSPANRTDRMETLNQTEQRSGKGPTEEA
jgi:hypothetical protein